MSYHAKEIKELISSEDLDLTEYSDTPAHRVIKRVTVVSKEKIRIRFVGGLEITQPLHLRSRHREMLAAWALPVSLCACFFLY